MKTFRQKVVEFVGGPLCGQTAHMDCGLVVYVSAPRRVQAKWGDAALSELDKVTFRKTEYHKTVRRRDKQIVLVHESVYCSHMWREWDEPTNTDHSR